MLNKKLANAAVFAASALATGAVVLGLSAVTTPVAGPAPSSASYGVQDPVVGGPQDPSENEALNSTATEEGGEILFDAGTETLATENFPTAESGLTYGSDAEAETIEDAPDLVAVVADNGRPGFIHKAVLYKEHNVSTLAQAKAYEDSLPNSGTYRSDVYDLNGVFVGLFTMPRGSAVATQ